LANCRFLKVISKWLREKEEFEAAEYFRARNGFLPLFKGVLFDLREGLRKSVFGS
jgi:hypothetical protein